MKNLDNNGRCSTEERYIFLRNTATAKGLTLRQETETGVKPRTFELVYRSAPKGSVPIKGGITREAVTLESEMEVLNLINSHYSNTSF